MATIRSLELDLAAALARAVAAEAEVARLRLVGTDIAIDATRYRKERDAALDEIDALRAKLATSQAAEVEAARLVDRTRAERDDAVVRVGRLEKEAADFPAERAHFVARAEKAKAELAIMHRVFGKLERENALLVEKAHALRAQIVTADTEAAARGWVRVEDVDRLRSLANRLHQECLDTGSANNELLALADSLLDEKGGG